MGSTYYYFGYGNNRRYYIDKIQQSLEQKHQKNGGQRQGVFVATNCITMVKNYSND